MPEVGSQVQSHGTGEIATGGLKGGRGSFYNFTPLLHRARIRVAALGQRVPLPLGRARQQGRRKKDAGL